MFIEELRQYKRYFLYFLKKNIEIVPTEGNDLGCTSNGVMQIAEDHPIMDGLSESEKKFFRLGVFTHEMLHHIFTKFDLLQDALVGKLPMERRVLSLMENLIEDPCIEYYAYAKLGGILLKALDYSIAVVYDKTPPLEASQNPFSQYVNALVMFGDMGLLKGKFTYPEAEEVFHKTAKLFSEGILEEKMVNRLQIAESLMNLSRPLWDFEDEDKTKETLKQTQESLKQQGKNSKDISDSMNGKDAERKPTDGSANKKAERRKSAVKSIQKNTGNSSSTESESSNADSSEFNLDDYKPNAEDVGEYNETIKLTNKGELKSIIQETPITVRTYESIDVPYSTASRLDRDMRLPKDNSLSYAELLSQCAKMISTLYSLLKRIFLSDSEEVEHRNRGRVNLKRVMFQKPTTRLFDKKKQPQNKQNMVVAIALDESGSMSNPQKVKTARKMAIIICEVLKKFKIPVTVVGYTTGGGYDVVHDLFVSFSNTRKERESLMNTGAYAGNFDSYTVQYMTQLLKKRKEAHKLLIVISDGQPSYGGKDPVRATKEAVDNARKDGLDVLGVSIYNNDEEKLKGIYGDDFIHGNSEKVIIDFVAKIKKYIKK